MATATLDAKMMKEAVKVRVHGKKRRECKHELEVTTSKAAVERDIEELEESNSFSLQDSGSKYACAIMQCYRSFHDHLVNPLFLFSRH